MNNPKVRPNKNTGIFSFNFNMDNLELQAKISKFGLAVKRC